MEGARRRWIVPVTGAVAAVLTVWGILGVGKASTVIPEEANGTTPAAVNESEMKFGKISGGVKKYDAALYLRGKPLKDPFYAVRSYDSKRENEEAPQMPAAEGTTGTIHLAPVLQGVMEYGGNRRAMLAVNGESVTVRKGDRVGIWSVVSIGEKTVQLSSAAGNLFLEGTLFFCFPFSVNAENRMPEMKLETSAHETMEATLRQSMEGRKEEKAKSYLTKHAVTEEKEPSDFSLHVKNAPIQEVLRSLAELTGKNIVFGGTVTGSVTADLDHVTPKEALHAMLVSQGLIAREEGSTLIVVGESAMKNGGRATKSYKLSYAEAKEVAEGLRQLSDSVHVAYNQTANAVILSGTPLEIMETAAVLRSLDVPEKQVKVEAEVIAVNRSHSKELGIDWDFKALTGSGEYRRESWNEQRYVTDDAGNIKCDKNGNPRMRNIEHNGWNVKIPEGYAGISYGRSVAGHPYTAFFRANLNALVSTGKARILARPNVVTMNGREAEILIGNKIPVIVEHVDNGVRTTTTEYRDAGIKLTYTPRISADGEITANVNAEVSTPYLVPEMRAYRIITRQANTLVRLRSGDMLTIGGLIDKEENKTFRKVPILGDIPLLGKLFQSKSRSVEESEIVIIIKAEILDR
ncbi:type II secretion system protein GspD [Dialister invisus]|uniref:type II secretion system protein GspD n=2 Tax=Dialister invisus TaxID=218538 RepID=UPI002352A68E|nr:secretin N-terminal domain-containing protein [Dialister invisus]